MPLTSGWTRLTTVREKPVLGSVRVSGPDGYRALQRRPLVRADGSTSPAGRQADRSLTYPQFDRGSEVSEGTGGELPGDGLEKP